MQIVFEELLGENRRKQARRLLPGVGVTCTNVKPSTNGIFRPWRVPLAVSPAPNIPSNRVTLYRMGRDTQSKSNFWLSWTGVVHAIRGFDATDPTERTYYTDGTAPKWTDNIQALSGAPYPTASRLLAVPQPTVAPTVALSVDGTGAERTVWYVYTWVNDIGWESAPSPATRSPAHRAGAVLNLTPNGTVPAGNYGVTKIRWYRTQTTGTLGEAEFFFLREYALGAAGQQDDARDVGADVLPSSAENMRLPLPNTATCLTQCWNEFAAALVGKTVRFCEPGFIYSWPLSCEYIVNDTPVAIAVFSQRALVLTSAGAELFTGTDPEAMDQKPMALAPIVSARSLVVGETWCCWAAADGLWYYGIDGYRNLVERSVDPAQWAALSPSTMHAHFLQVGDKQLIVVFYNDGTNKGLVVDPQNPEGVYFLSEGYTAAYWDKLLRRLFVLVGSSLREWDAGASFMSAVFKSQVFRQQNFEDSAEWVELVGTGSMTVKVFTENPASPDAALIERMSRSLTTGVHTLPAAAVGRDWQVELNWTDGGFQALSIY